MSEYITNRPDVGPGIGTKYRGDSDTFDVYRDLTHIGTVDSTRDRTGEAFAIIGDAKFRFRDVTRALAYIERLTNGSEPFPVRVASISARYTRTAQLWRDDWRGVDRVCRYTGACVVCGMRTYAFDDGENDPRGALGDRADHSLTAADHDAYGPDVPLCALCGNDYDRYTRGQEIAHRRWDRARRRVVGMAERLNARVEFDHPFRVTVGGDLADAPAGIYAPTSTDGELDGRDWEYWSHGRSGQYGYSGPILHASEFLGGGMAVDLLMSPGIYAIVADENGGEDVPEDFPVRELDDLEALTAGRAVTDGECGRTWDDSISTAYTPAPSARCPFEAFHRSEEPNGWAVVRYIGKA